MPTDLPNYRILFEENTHRLEDAVNEWIAKGYKPVGRVWVKEVLPDEELYFQSVYKMPEPEK